MVNKFGQFSAEALLELSEYWWRLVSWEAGFVQRLCPGFWNFVWMGGRSRWRLNSELKGGKAGGFFGVFDC